jgi:hypothetical protein
MVEEVRTVKDIDVNLKNTIILGTITNILWIVYQYRTQGQSLTVLYMLIGLVIQLYILRSIILKEKDLILSSNERSH